MRKKTKSKPRSFYHYECRYCPTCEWKHIFEVYCYNEGSTGNHAIHQHEWVCMGNKTHIFSELEVIEKELLGPIKLYA